MLLCTGADTRLYSERNRSSETSCQPFLPTYNLIPTSRIDISIQNGLSVCETKILPALVFISLRHLPVTLVDFRIIVWRGTEN